MSALIKTTRILDVKYFLLLPRLADMDTPIDDIQWSAVLRSVSGLQMYRMRFGRIVPLNIVDFMILDESFPRSVRHCVAASAKALQTIAGGVENDATRVAESLRRQLESGVAVDIVRGGLHEFIDSTQMNLNELGILVSETYFSSQPVIAMASAGLQ